MTEAHPSLEIQNAAGFLTNNQIDKLVPDVPELPGIGQWSMLPAKKSRYPGHPAASWLEDCGPWFIAQRLTAG
jgi:hypothetical protein